MSRQQPLKPLSVQVKEAVEHALPAYMLELLVGAMEKCPTTEGRVYFREDLKDKLGRAVAACFGRLDQLTLHMAVGRLERDGLKILQAVSEDPNKDYRPVLAACARMVLKLVDDRLYWDATNQAVLASLMINEEMDKYPEEWGPPLRREQNAGLMMNEARRLGYYRGLRLVTA